MASITCPRIASSCLRSLKSPTILASHKSSPFTTTTRSQFSQLSRPSIILRAAKSPFSKQPATPSLCNAFTTTRAVSSSESTTAGSNVLTWDHFFNLRKKRRWINTGSSVLTAVGAVVVIAPILVQRDVDSYLAGMSGLDPFIVLGITGMAVGAAGWLCGPIFGGLVFKMWAGRGGRSRILAEKEKSFYARIKRYRGDPSRSSPQNPVPDYYGEKITSVKDYRRWLKDQRTFARKRDKDLL